MTTTKTTGRDEYIEAQALVYAIAYIKSLPERQQERSNMSDMLRIAQEKMEPGTLAAHWHAVEVRRGKQAPLFDDEDFDAAEDISYSAMFDTIMSELREAQKIARSLEPIDDAFGDRAIDDYQSSQGLIWNAELQSYVPERSNIVEFPTGRETRH